MTSIGNNSHLLHNTGRFYGKYRGTVCRNDDPKNQGRIRAYVPEILGEKESEWALPCGPYTGNGSGVYTIPKPEAGVWIEFEAGDVSRPIWCGCWWAENQLPKDERGMAATPPLKIIRSEKGLMVCMDDKGQTIHISDANGANMLEIQVKPGKIMIKGATKAVVEAPQIELVESAKHPVVFGDLLLQYLNQLVLIFNTHMHPGELWLGLPFITPAPPVSPFQPATPKMLSKRVTTG